MKTIEIPILADWVEPMQKILNDENENYYEIKLIKIKKNDANNLSAVLELSKDYKELDMLLFAMMLQHKLG